VLKRRLPPEGVGLDDEKSAINPPSCSRLHLVVLPGQSHCWASMHNYIRKETIGKVGMFKKSSRCGEDWKFSLRLVHITDFVYIDIPLVIQRRDLGPTPSISNHDKLALPNLFIAIRTALRGDPEALGAFRHIASFGAGVIWRLGDVSRHWRSACGLVHTA
jgi:hypothetical protein